MKPRDVASTNCECCAETLAPSRVLDLRDRRRRRRLRRGARARRLRRRRHPTGDRDRDRAALFRAVLLRRGPRSLSSAVKRAMLYAAATVSFSACAREVRGARVAALVADEHRHADHLVAIVLDRLDFAAPHGDRQAVAFGDLGRRVGGAERLRVPQDVGRDFLQLVLGVREKALPDVHVCCHCRCRPVGARVAWSVFTSRSCACTCVVRPLCAAIMQVRAAYLASLTTA